MDELDDRGQVMVMPALLTPGTGRQQHERRAHALAATTDDVLCNLANERDVRVKTIADDRIDGLHVRPDQGVKLFHGHIKPALG